MFSKMVQDYGNRLADICLVMQAVGQAGHSLFMRQLQSLWTCHRTLRTALSALAQNKFRWAGYLAFRSNAI